MAKKLLPCNLTEEEQASAWEEFDDGLLTRDEVERVNEVLTPYLFYTTGRNGKERECICTHFDCGKFVVKVNDNPGFFRKKHNEETQCPRCGGIVNLVAMGRIRTFNKLNDAPWVRITLCRTGKDGALLLLSGYVKRYFCWDDLRPDPEISWKAFTYLMPGKRMQWIRTWEPQGQHVCGDWWWGFQWNRAGAVKEPFNPGFKSWYSTNDGDSYFLNADAIGRSSMSDPDIIAYQTLAEQLMNSYNVLNGYRLKVAAGNPDAGERLKKFQTAMVGQWAEQLKEKA